MRERLELSVEGDVLVAYVIAASGFRFRNTVHVLTHTSGPFLTD